MLPLEAHNSRSQDQKPKSVRNEFGEYLISPKEEMEWQFSMPRLRTIEK